MRQLGPLETALPLLLVIILVFPTLGQLPPNNCSPRFVYRGYQGQYIGQVTVRLNPFHLNHELRLEFSQQGYHNFGNNVGTISLADGEDRTAANVREDLPVVYRVDFPIPTSPPKIIGISINGEQICSALEYRRPRTGITLVHTLTLPLIGSPDQIRNSNWNPPNRQPSQPSFITEGAYEESFPRRNTTTEESQTFFEQEETLLEPERQLRPVSPGRTTSNPPSRPNQAERPSSVRDPVALLGERTQGRQPSESWITTRPPQINNRETLVSQQAPSPPSSRGSIQCGRERATTTPLVFQGTHLQRGQLPWLVGMFERRESNGPIFFCGGSLIGASTVLTAAHCFRIPGYRDLPASRTAVSLGRNSLDLLSDGDFRGVSQLLIHEKYNIEQYTQADLALARLETPVTFGDFIRPICLWSSANRLDLPQGETTYVAGWGPDESGTGNSDVAKLADMNIVSEANCHRQLPPGPLSQPSTLCAQKAKTGPCSTDGGGPLMIREGDVWLLRGVIAGGALNQEQNTCDLGLPSVFTDVAKHIDWVRRNMWN